MKAESRMQNTIYELMPPLVRYIYPLIHKYTWNDIVFRENQILIIMALYYEKSLTPSRLSTMLDRPKGSLTTIIRDLLKCGLISKEKNMEDERSYILQLTPLAFEFLEQKKKTDKERLEKLFSGLTESDEAKISEGISVLADYLNSLEEKLCET